ncbi:MAG: hypothetical protein WBA17_13900 [Saprospiraceae bacterium]
MHQFFINRSLRRLEREGNDDFLLLREVGARPFATHELHHLLRRLQLNYRAVRAIKRTQFAVVSAIAALAAAGLIVLAFGQVTIALVLFLLVPTSCLVLLIAQIRLRRRNRLQDHAELLHHLIGKELERRRQESEII